MVCDYHFQSELVIEYIDTNGAMSTTKTNRVLGRGYLSEEDDVTLKQCIERNTYKRLLYENGRWVKESYEKKYAKELQITCPRLVKLVKMYKDHTAWERDK